LAWIQEFVFSKTQTTSSRQTHLDDAIWFGSHGPSIIGPPSLTPIETGTNMKWRSTPANQDAERVERLCRRRLTPPRIRKPQYRR
jgi:hypothetical protein